MLMILFWQSFTFKTIISSEDFHWLIYFLMQKCNKPGFILFTKISPRFSEVKTNILPLRDNRTKTLLSDLVWFGTSLCSELFSIKKFFPIQRRIFKKWGIKYIIL